MLTKLVIGKRVSSSTKAQTSRPKYIDSFLDPEGAMSVVLSRPSLGPEYESYSDSVDRTWSDDRDPLKSMLKRNEPKHHRPEPPTVESETRVLRGVEIHVHRSSWSDRVQYIVHENGVRKAYSQEQFVRTYGFSPVPEREVVELKPLFALLKMR